MADHTYDKNPTIPDTIKFRTWRFGYREVTILAAIALLLFILCCLFAGLFGSAKVQLDEAHTRSQVAVAKACKDPGCLRTMAHAVELLNISASPCDNFFNFACGRYSVVNPLDRYRIFHDVQQQIRDDNEDRLAAILEPSSFNARSWSSDVKLKNFYWSCMDDFTRENLKATPLLEKVLPMLGGWYVTNASWNASTWDLNAAMQIVHTDLWVEAFYSARIDLDNKTKIFRIDVPGRRPGMTWMSITDLTTDYMRYVAQLVARDAKVTDQNLINRINIFVEDAFNVESEFLKVYMASWEYTFTEVTLEDLTRNSVIDWTAQIRSMHPWGGLSGTTKVVVKPDYISNLTAMIINKFDQDSRNRILHNYLTWHVLETYVQDLSWEYYHAIRQVPIDFFAGKDFLDKERHCFHQAQKYFQTALGALYVTKYFEEKNKKKVTEITEAVKEALEALIQDNSWMDAHTKAYAIEKMQGATYELGYPDFMKDQSNVDAFYEQLTINQDDYVGNLLKMNQQRKLESFVQLRDRDIDLWISGTYTTNIEVSRPLARIRVPAGILQWPLYSYDMPHYYSFGAFATILSTYILAHVDETGSLWDKSGSYMGPERRWWSNLTYANYKKARQCVADLYNTVTHGPYEYWDDWDREFKQKMVAVNGDEYAPEAMAITTGIRLAYNAYKAWEKKNGEDSSPPGLQYTPEQLFYIAHAQTRCYNRDPSFFTAERVIGETRVNLALQELPEFSAAFGCKAGDNMFRARRCTYY